MKASELVKVLQDQIQKYGDQEVVMDEINPEREGPTEPVVRSVAMLSGADEKASYFLLQDSWAALEMGDCEE